MPREKTKAVPEGNCSIPIRGGIILEQLRRVMSETMGEAFKYIKENLRRMDRRLASLEQDARQSRLAIEADAPTDKTTRERTEGAATAVQAEHGDSCSAKRALAGPKGSTRFGVKTNLPLSLAGMTS